MDMSTLLGQAQPVQQPLAQQPLSPIINGDMAQLPAPPATPQELEAKKSGWSQALDDPNLKSAIFRMGLNLLRGQEPGESVAGTIGRTGIDAMDYYGFKNELDRKKALEQQKLTNDTNNVNSEIASRTAQTAQTQQQTQQEGTKFAEWQSQAQMRKDTAQADYNRLVAQGKSADAQALKDKFAADEAQRNADFIAAHPELDTASRTAMMQKPQLEAAREKAQTAQANASAGASAASTNLSNFNLKEARDKANAVPAWIDTMPDKEAQQYALTQMGLKSQEQIMADIAAGKHHGIDRQFDKTGGLQLTGYDGMADSLISQYNALPAKTKNTYPNIDEWIMATQQATVGPQLGNVLAVVKQKMGTGAANVPAQPNGPHGTTMPPPDQRQDGMISPNGLYKWSSQQKGWIDK